MANTDTLIRYYLIIKKLRRSSCTFKDIEDYLMRESELQERDLNISKRTFQRDIKAIREIYNIDIQFDFSRQVYYIDFDEQPELNKRVMEAFDLLNVLSITERLSKNIQFEQRQSQGTIYMHDLLEAIKNGNVVQFKHKKFWEESSTYRRVWPLTLKEFRSRWYLIAEDSKDEKVKSFGLDRMSELDITNNHFKKPDNFKVNELYRHSFGIIGPNNKEPEEVIISFTEHQGKYIKTMPLHHSQEILVDNEKELVVKLYIIISFDFEMELMSMADELKVIKPQSLVESLKSKAQRMLKRYESDTQI